MKVPMTTKKIINVYLVINNILERLMKLNKKICLKTHFNFLMISFNFIFLLGKSIYTYEFMDNWDKFNETSLPEKEEFYSDVNMENITDSARKKNL